MSTWTTSLYRYRQIQYLMSSFTVYLTQTRWVLVLQLLFLVCGFVSAIIGRFYFWERYHLYGCRKDYETGFPQICPIHRRNNGIDLATGTCYAVSGLFLWIMTVVPVMWMKFHWKCRLANEIVSMSRRVLSEREIFDSRITGPLQSFLTSAEGVGTPCCRQTTANTRVAKDVHRHHFLTHLGSCLWSELYLLYVFKQWKAFALYIILICLVLTIPLASPLLSHGWSTFVMLTGMLCFMVCPIFSGLLLLIIMTCVMLHPVIQMCAFLACWCVLCAGMMFFSFWKGKHDEIDLMRRAYGQKLQTSVHKLLPTDVDTLLFIRGYGRGSLLLTDLQKGITDLSKRMSK